jgi:hypothetical protein
MVRDDHLAPLQVRQVEHLPGGARRGVGVCVRGREGRGGRGEEEEVEEEERRRRCA